MDKQYYKHYYHLERSHWWFTARLEILKSKVKKILADTPNPKILNIGIATGATSIMLQEFGEVTSLEYDKDCCEFVIEKCGIDVTQGSMTELPYDDNTYDLVCAFDVIEHIEDHTTAMAEMKRVLSERGHFFVTVPAYMFLWSEHDVVNHHFRRYTRNNFNSLLQQQGLNIQYSSYFNSLLFPMIAGVRVLQNGIKALTGKGEKPKSDFEGANSVGMMNSILKAIFLAEKPLLNSGIRFPAGVSVMTYGTKSS